MQTVYGISLGPGDPELITLKALRLLKESDIIFYPGSLYADGRKESYVLSMLQQYGLESAKFQGFFLEMSSSDRSAAEKTYAATAEKILEAYKSEKKVSIVCEGDLSFYASFSYVLEQLHLLNVAVELVPGVNSFSLGAAKHQVPISLQNEKVVILPLAQDIEEIEKAFADFQTIILMKIRSGWKQLSGHLSKKDWQIYYCERLGTDAEFITTDVGDLENREIPYFSLLIIKK